VRRRRGCGRAGATHSAFGEAETLLNERGQLADAAAVGAKNFHSAGGPDDDLGPDWRLAHLHSGEAVLGQLLGQELAQLSVEDTVGDELALLADVVLSDNGCRHCFACKGWRVKSLHFAARCVAYLRAPPAHTGASGCGESDAVSESWSRRRSGACMRHGTRGRLLLRWLGRKRHSAAVVQCSAGGGGGGERRRSGVVGDDEMRVCS
jgi:hypothetical protein